MNFFEWFFMGHAVVLLWGFACVALLCCWIYAAMCSHQCL